MNIKVSELKEVKSAECINCQSCILSCPKNNTLEFKVKNKSVKPVFVFAFVFILFFGGIGVTKLMGVFNVLPAPVTSETNMKPEDIKGYMTLEDVSKGLKMDLNEVYKKLDLPTSISKDTKLKDIQNTIPDFETEGAREKLK